MSGVEAAAQLLCPGVVRGSECGKRCVMRLPSTTAVQIDGTASLPYSLARALQRQQDLTSCTGPSEMTKPAVLVHRLHYRCSMANTAQIHPDRACCYGCGCCCIAAAVAAAVLLLAVLLSQCCLVSIILLNAEAYQCCNMATSDKNRFLQLDMHVAIDNNSPTTQGGQLQAFWSFFWCQLTSTLARLPCNAQHLNSA